jgi:hypothetical protein
VTIVRERERERESDFSPNDWPFEKRGSVIPVRYKQRVYKYYVHELQTVKVKKYEGVQVHFCSAEVSGHLYTAAGLASVKISDCAGNRVSISHSIAQSLY